MALALKRRRRPAAGISVVSMIDVLMIMLIFFMVTSTYLDLDMIPAAERADESAPPPLASTAPARSLMVRIAPDGFAYVQGQPLAPEALETRLTEALAADPDLQVVLLPSATAKMQALVETMDVAARAGAKRVKVLRLEARE